MWLSSFARHYCRQGGHRHVRSSLSDWKDNAKNADLRNVSRSAWATVQYMKNQKMEGKVYFVGEPGLGQELAAEGFEPFGLEHSDIKGLPMPFTVDKSTKAVVVGLDRCVFLIHWYHIHGADS